MLEHSQPRSLRACSRDDPECGARRGVLRRRLATACPGRPGKSPARHYDLAARSSLYGPGGNAGEGSVGPEPKIATVERREAGVPRYGTRGASPGAWPAASRAGPGCPSTRTSLGAPPPLDGGREATKQNPGAKKRAAGTKRCCVMRSLSVRHSGRAATAARAGIHNHGPWVWIPGSRALPAPRNEASGSKGGPV